ncbi:hypothetical protein ACPCTO_06230 [Streptomyces olivoreticuli]
MHFHGYLWAGDKAAFDKEGARRPESPAFALSETPPMQTAHWLLKPARIVRGTWADPREASTWLGERLSAALGARFPDTVTAVAERLAGGGDVSYGHYLARPSFLSIAVVTCTPNSACPDLGCPIASR